MSSVSDKSVSFNVHDLQKQVADSGMHSHLFSLDVFFIPSPLAITKSMPTAVIDPLEREIRELAESMSAVKDEQEYIVIRERQHRDSIYLSLTVLHSTCFYILTNDFQHSCLFLAAESTNSRVKWWSLGQLGLLVGVCFWQIFYLKRFFEVKRVV